ncbi:MAG: cysteine desulfurase [Candidatus Micrarchaeota archaeon]|nr:cysteine desulfurase [Candidatus Micrarchaeota archaeon]
METLDVDAIRKDFPILKRKMNGKRLVYLDSAATSQKPIQVIKTICDYYKEQNANIHRGLYQLSADATERYVDSKRRLAKFINASEMQEIVYVRNATEAINLVAYAWGAQNVQKGDRILLTELEHHSNIVPWMELARRKGAVLEYAKMDDKVAHVDMGDFMEKIEKRPKIVAFAHMSNVLGTINNVKEMTKAAHKNGATVLVDGAQSAPHMKVDVREIDCDFFALSGHKMLAPMGIGALYGKRQILEDMEPFLTGGDMIKSVHYHSYEKNELPWKFEAGTPNVEGGLAFTAAIDYLEGLGMDKVRQHEKEVTKYAIEELGKVKGVKIYGPGMEEIERRGGVVSFSVDKVHPHDVSQILGEEGIAIRAGHHCAMPLVTERLGEAALSRFSFYIYNKSDEVDKAIRALKKVRRIFRV